MELTERERATLLRALFELWVTQSAFEVGHERSIQPNWSGAPPLPCELAVFGNVRGRCFD